MAQVQWKQHFAPHQSFFCEHSRHVPSFLVVRRMTDGKPEIFAHPRIQTHDINVLYRLFTLIYSVA